MAGEPVSLAFSSLLKRSLVPQIEHLHFDPVRQPRPFEAFQRRGKGPNKNPGVPSIFHVSPFADQFKVGVLFLSSHDTDRFPGAMNLVTFERPRVISTIHLGKISFTERNPPRARAINSRNGLGFISL